jgi:hypothetical protein
MKQPADPRVSRALDLSQELLNAAEKGEMQRVVDLDAERGRMLREFLKDSRRIGAADRALLDDIQRLNDLGLSRIEKRRRETCEEFAQLGRGRRAVDAYAHTQGSGK